MIKKLKNQQGSYTLEALISLTAFVIVIMLAYMQVKAVIAEQIMQHAVDNISQQVASYVYIIDARVWSCSIRTMSFRTPMA